MGKKKKTGLSIHKCITDIINGEVEEEDVKKIIGRTTASDEKVWRKVITYYKAMYWNKNPKEAERILRRMIKGGRIEQPLLKKGGTHPGIEKGHWQ